MFSVRILAALTGLLLIILVVSAPARLLGSLLPSGSLIMQGLGGSVWRGSAARAIVVLDHGYLHLGTVNWRLSPLSLLLLSPQLELQSQWGNQEISGNVTVRGAQDFDLHKFEARLSARLLRQFTPLQLGGRFSLQNTTLQVREGVPFGGQGRLLWQDATWISSSGPNALGSYAVDFEQADKEALKGRVVTLSGPVNASGTLELQNRSYALNILLHSAGGLDPQLKQTLSLVAQPEGDKFRIKLDGNL